MQLNEFSGQEQSVGFAIQNATTKTSCKLLVLNNKQYSVFLNDKKYVDSKEQLTPVLTSEVQFLSVKTNFFNIKNKNLIFKYQILFIF